MAEAETGVQPDGRVVRQGDARVGPVHVLVGLGLEERLVEQGADTASGGLRPAVDADLDGRGVGRLGAEGAAGGVAQDPVGRVVRGIRSGKPDILSNQKAVRAVFRVGVQP
ncbi:hypothetical protein GCM10010271_26770 [Streptomyces kurssanovii]|nr:hypothetical protein GCM10010271_26770 [Streptomyces kurssanovii]